MHRLRERWVALFGGALLVTLSVSAALGANPHDDTDGPPGQAVADFVHSLIFTEDEPEGDEPALGEDEVEDTTGADAVLTEDEADTEAEAQLHEVTGAEHGACVSEEASDKTDETAEDGNHGAVVSEAARVTCWEEEVTTAGTDGTEAVGASAVTRGNPAFGHAKGGRGHGRGRP